MLQDRQTRKHRDELLNRVANGAIVVVAVCAVAIVVLRLGASSTTEDPIGRENRTLSRSDWSDAMNGSHRLGSDAPKVLIVEFGDYECPYCRRIEPVLQAILRKYPKQVALVYRHFPMNYHKSAHSSSMLAACAEDQNEFEGVHRYLYEVADLSQVTARKVLSTIPVADTTRFLNCTASDAAASVIQKDLDLASRLGVRGTPTLIVNRVLLGSLPDSARLMLMVDSVVVSAVGG